MGGIVHPPDGEPKEVSDLEMMQHPEYWPQGFRLPMKRPKWEVGVLVAWDDDEWYWFPGKSMFHELSLIEGQRLTKADLQKILDDGWTVD